MSEQGQKPGETQYARSHPLHGRVHVALPERSIVSGRALSVSVAELCVLLDDQIPIGASLMIRFDLFACGKLNVVTAPARAAYGIFASLGGFRVGFEFTQEDPKRSALIESLTGRKMLVGAASPARSAGPTPVNSAAAAASTGAKSSPVSEAAGAVA